VELAYGGATKFLQRRLPFWWSIVAFLLFTAFMLWLTLVKNRVVARWTRRVSSRANPPAPSRATPRG
jgi:hypothetical protein